MVANPFDDPDGVFVVLTNDQGYHCVWPAFVDVPAGWVLVHGEAGRADCLAYISRNWTDARPTSLAGADLRDGPDRAPRTN
jgi:MbtH protein